MPFELIRNDITKMKVDAVVNAANTSLLGGGGVDGAIHHAAGPELLEECRTLGGCKTGEAKITNGYRLPARYVIHTVGPVWHGGGNGERALLASCYRRSLELAAENGCESLAFPLISAGAYGYPKDQAVSVAVETITGFLLDHDMMVYLVIFGHDALVTGKKLFRDIREYIDDVYAEKHLVSRIENRREQLWQQNEEAALDLDIQLGADIRKDSVCASIQEEGPDTDDQTINHMAATMAAPDWDQILKKTDKGFSETLLEMIDERGMTDAQCYKKANIDRKLFSKIRSNPAYQPSKPTVLAFAVALELSLPETKRLLNKAGFSLTRSNELDVILEYCITHRFYNIYDINLVLFQYDMPLLGSGMS